MATPITNPNSYRREYGQSLVSPAARMLAITPDDYGDLPAVIKSMRVCNPTDGAVNVSIRTIRGDEVVLTFLPGVYREDVQITRVFATNTTDGVILHGYFD